MDRGRGPDGGLHRLGHRDPGALYRYRQQHQTGGRLALILISGTLPGVIAGSVIRVELVPGPRVFDLMVAALLLPLGIWLAATRPARARDPARPARRVPALALIVLAALTGCAGGIYGIGGGYLGARMQSRVPDTLIRRVVGVLAIAIAAQFLKSGLS